MSTSIDDGGGNSVGAGLSLNHSPNTHPYHYVHPQHHHGGKKNSSGSSNGKGSLSPSSPPPPISLVISPNLDALLAHEERLRSARPQTPEPTHSAGGSIHMISPGAGGENGVVVRGNGEEEGGPVGLPPPPRRTARGAGKSPLQTARRAVVMEAAEAAAVAAECPRATPEPEVLQEDNPYINHAPTLEEVLSGAGSEERSRDLGERSRRRGRVPSAIDPRTPTMTTDGGQRRRPLLSHGPQPSVSSMESAGSTGPASTAENEPRISISSTIYPASSTHSLPHSLYNQPSSERASFIDLYSPQRGQFVDASPITFAHPDDPRPPLPTTPKPAFPRHPTMPADERPPTTNFLDMGERADLIRKTRKLARVFGQTPGADAMAQQDANRATAINPSRTRAALSLVDNTLHPIGPRRVPVDAAYSRRHSMPLTPDDVSFLSIVSPGFEPTAFLRTPPASSLVSNARAESPTSFMDLSDDEFAAAAAKRAKGKSSTASGANPAGSGAPVLRSKISVQSIDTLSSDDLAEEERRRKRERLAKLHRFLGSRVPAHLVLGTADPADPASLPPPQASSEDDSSSSRKTWLKRRRSSSAVILPSFRLDELERVKEELDGKEKAINVRRAHKMEKVFGVAPPQTLYHTRHCPTSRPLSSGDPSTSSGPSSNAGTGTSTPSSFLGALPSLPTQSRAANAKRAAYLPKVRMKTKKGGRPGTAESSKQLLAKDGEDGPATATLTTPVDPRHSFVYTHYQHSLNSLNDILDRDDRASLVELHEYLNSTDIPTPTLANPISVITRPGEATAHPDHFDDFDEGGINATDVTLAHAIERRLSLASLKSERRRSLPARTSMVSLAPSELTIAGAPTDAMDFQQRRRRAAKLTQFFGVNYRELITDVLDSIENGVAHEGARGTLRAEEVEDLLTRLRTLKTKRTSLFS